MNTEKNILVAFVLNLAFAIFEFFGGVITGSVAIMSDAIHDLGDAASIGVSFYLERKSKKPSDNNYTYGYGRYSVLGGIFTTFILLIGSVMVICNAVNRIINPTVINYNGMIIFAIIGVIVNFSAAYLTRDGDSINQKAVNLHMLEDVLGWVIVLIGAVVMRFTDFAILDPVLSIGVAVFILVNAVRNLKEAVNLFLEKTPKGISVDEIRNHVLQIEGISDVHHIHIWSIDGEKNYATMHIVSDEDGYTIKEKIREELSEHKIVHATLELEATGEPCQLKNCDTAFQKHSGCCHHHH